MKDGIAIFEEKQIRRVYDEKSETWFFSVVDIVQVLTDQPDFQTARKYWNKLKTRLKAEGSELVTNCHQLKLTSQDGKKYKTDVADAATLLRLVQSVPSPSSSGWPRLADRGGAYQLIFTALAELSTRHIAESMKATGLNENTEAGKRGGGIARQARRELEQSTGQKVVTASSNILPPVEED
ncbi:hypothetical protein LJC59_02130 [Desulfovibrio sp. OttesenSCG-928-A18]|nr:hypothetical protein [Desulfovibrio sp. OttesenSCG-928-A18]